MKKTCLLLIAILTLAAAAFAQKRAFTIEDVYRADEVFCTGTMGELAGVTTIDGRAIGSGAVGPMTGRLSQLYAQRTATEGVPVVD